MSIAYKKLIVKNVSMSDINETLSWSEKPMLDWEKSSLKVSKNFHGSFGNVNRGNFYANERLSDSSANHPPP